MEQIGKRFASVTALNAVTLRLNPGEIHGLIGENGAGKSTLIKILAGVYQADSG
ncbi:ATP-binding cassette domain-containing protein, partial [Mycobacterium tuberculosis]|nr:ATP-binding cassette domain-containing protein [Mycobacterium tuberculosis]